MLAAALAPLIGAPAAAATPPSAIRIAFVPMDDRPAAEQFPQSVASIAGARLVLPPQTLLGHFTQPGDADGIGRWLLDLDTADINAVVISADMLAYGGLVASRTAATPLADARARIRVLARFHEMHPALPIYVFATIMRLSPTETPQSEPYLDALASYARAAGAASPTAEQSADLARLRAQIPDGAFWDYVGARARDVDTDETLIAMAAQGSIAWLALTQDDAGSPDGLQVAEQRQLGSLIQQLDAADRARLSAGADEMGMVAVTRALEDAAGWHPTVAIAYSTQRAPLVKDPLEDVPIGQTIANLAAAMHEKVVEADADLTLDVFAPSTPADARRDFASALVGRLREGAPIAVADLAFIDDDLTEERFAFETLRSAGVAARPLAFGSWNTTANSAGTALSAATCASLASHFGLDTAQARETFLFDRYVDDYAYRLLVRPGLNAELRAAGIDTYALGSNAPIAESKMRERLWPLAVELFDEVFSSDGWKQDELSMYLPWQRTFEVRLDAMLIRA